MISVGVSKLEKTSVFFVEPGAKVNSQYYQEKILDKILLEMHYLSNGDFVFLQDGARFHTAKTTLEYLEEHCPEFVKPDFWPPNSRDLSVLDFAVWIDFERKVWENQPHDIENFKKAIIKEWDAYPQEKINNSINAFRKRLKCVVEDNGRYVEHYK